MPSTKAKPDSAPAPTTTTVLYRCPACEVVISGDWPVHEDDGYVLHYGNYFCSTHNLVLERAILGEGQTADDIWPPPSEEPTAESGEASGGPVGAVDSPDVTPVE